MKSTLSDHCSAGILHYKFSILCSAAAAAITTAAAVSPAPADIPFRPARKRSICFPNSPFDPPNLWAIDFQLSHIKLSSRISTKPLKNPSKRLNQSLEFKVGKSHVQ